LELAITLLFRSATEASVRILVPKDMSREEVEKLALADEAMMTLGRTAQKAYVCAGPDHQCCHLTDVPF
jgi:hypothetical protein